MKGLRTWVLICDGGRARVLANAAAGARLAPVDGLSFATDLPRSRDLMSERPGRAHESHGAARHAYEQRSDAHDQMKADFLGSVVAAIAARQEKGEFDRLVVVAPPAALGVVRAKLPDRLARAVAAEVAKDLTKTADGEIAGHLGDAIAI